jgi:serine protease Do
MGVKVQQVTREIAEAMGTTQPAGSLVSWVLPDSPASKAGLAIGDVIVKYGDDTPSDERALLRDIGRTDIGKTIHVVVLREGVEHSFPVTIEPWPRARWEERDAPVAALSPKATIPPDLGLTLTTIDKSQRAKLGVEEGWNGVLISAVQANSDAARRGAVIGDIILRVQDRNVASPAEVLHAIAKARADQRPVIMMLVLPKVRTVPGPRWVTLRLNDDAG